MNSENTIDLTDRQLLERILVEVGAVNHRVDDINKRIEEINNRLTSFEEKTTAHFMNLNERIVGLEVQTDKLTSLAYQALSVAHAVKGDVRALHGYDIQFLQRQTLKAA